MRVLVAALFVLLVVASSARADTIVYRRGTDIWRMAASVLKSNQLSDEQVNQKIEQMKAARAAKKFADSDAIRAELTAQGILIEQTKEGVRWRRK